MTISKKQVFSVIGAVILGLVVNVIWEGLIRLTSLHFPRLHVEAIQVAHFVGYVTSALIGVFLGRELERGSISSVSSALGVPRRPLPQSKIFVLEIVGTLPLDDPNTDWKFFLNNCTGRTLRAVTLYNIQSDLGTYRLGFHEIPLLRPFEKVELKHELWSRRMVDRHNGMNPTLWDFANDITGEGRSSYIWYKILVEYREAEDEAVHCGDFLFVCFDLPAKKMKNDGIDDVLRTKFDGWEP